MIWRIIERRTQYAGLGMLVLLIGSGSSTLVVVVTTIGFVLLAAIVADNLINFVILGLSGSSLYFGKAGIGL